MTDKHHHPRGDAVSPDLPPDVRDRAAQAAREAVIVGKPWKLVPEREKAELFAIVDAVAEVLAADQGATKADLLADVGHVARIGHENELRLQARVELLTAALTGLLKADYDSHSLTGEHERATARAALAAAVEEKTAALRLPPRDES